jgi:hypothetical protein
MTFQSWYCHFLALVTLGKSLNLSLPIFLLVKLGDNSHVKGLLEGVSWYM